MFGKDYFERIFKKGTPWGLSTLSYERVKYERQIEMMRRFAPSAQSILEIGCAEGDYTTMMAKAYPDAIINALDISHIAVEKAKNSCQTYGNILVMAGDIIELLKGQQHFSPESLDIVIQSECLYYLFPKLVTSLYLYEYFRNMTGIMKKGGVFLTANSMRGAIWCVMPLYHTILRRFLKPVYNGKFREWNQYRNEFLTYELRVFRRTG